MNEDINLIERALAVHERRQPNVHFLPIPGGFPAPVLDFRASEDSTARRQP